MQVKTSSGRQGAARPAGLSTSPVQPSIQPPLAPRARDVSAACAMRAGGPPADADTPDAVVVHACTRAAAKRVDLSPWVVPPAPAGKDIPKLLAYLQTLNVKYAPLFEEYCLRLRRQGAQDDASGQVIDQRMARLAADMEELLEARQAAAVRCVAAGCDAARIPPLSRPDFREPSTWPAADRERVAPARPPALDLALVCNKPDDIVSPPDFDDMTPAEALAELTRTNHAYALLYREWHRLDAILEVDDAAEVRAQMDALRPAVQACCRKLAVLRTRLFESGMLPWQLPKGLPNLFPGL